MLGIGGEVDAGAHTCRPCPDEGATPRRSRAHLACLRSTPDPATGQAALQTLELLFPNKGMEPT